MPKQKTKNLFFLLRSKQIFIKAQASIEFLFIMGFAMLLLLPSLALFGHFVQETTTTATAAQLQKIANGLLATAKQVYYNGNGSSIVLEVNLPEGLTEIRISEEEQALIFIMDIAGAPSELVYFSDVPIQGSFEAEDWTKGRKKFKMISTNHGYVVSIERWIK